MMKHLRAIAREPRHITKESDSDFLDKYGLPSVHQVLLTRSQGFAARHAPDTVSHRVGVACFDAHVIGSRPPLYSFNFGLCSGRPTHVFDSLQYLRMWSFSQHCGMCFNNLHQVKTHEGRAHGARAPAQVFDAAQRDSYSLHGLPQRRFCLQKFTRWRNLQRHIHRNGCPALRSNDKPTFGLTVVPEDVPLPASPPGGHTESKWKSVAAVETAGQLPLCRWPSVRACAASKSWQTRPCPCKTALCGLISGLRNQMACGNTIALCMRSTGPNGSQPHRPKLNSGPRRQFVLAASAGPVSRMPDNMQASV